MEALEHEAKASRKRWKDRSQQWWCFVGDGRSGVNEVSEKD